MKAIEIRVNKIKFVKSGTIESQRLKEALRIDKFGSEEFLDSLCHNGCPKMLGKHFTSNCINGGCNICWKQQPFEFIKSNPQLYNK